MFTPLRFQSSLAAGGLALMPFVLMQLTFPHAGKLMTARDLPVHGLGGGTLFLLAVMIAATVVHFALSAGSARGLVAWLADWPSARAFISDPRRNSGIFSPAISIGMTVNVLLGPVAFFAPSSALVGLGFLLYVPLFATLALLSAVAVRSWMLRPLASGELNFVWLLDVFAWSMAALAGGTLAASSTNPTVALISTWMTVASLAAGLALYAVKGARLLGALLKHRSVPSGGLQPAFFVTVPINCLFGVGAFKVSRPLDQLLGTQTSGLALSFLLLLFAVAALWAVAIGLTLRDWFLRGFPRPEFHPTQWGLVCLFVGLEVLALYAHVNWHPHPAFVAFAWVATAAAAAIYALVFTKFTGLYAARPAVIPPSPGDADAR